MAEPLCAWREALEASPPAVPPTPWRVEILRVQPKDQPWRVSGMQVRAADGRIVEHRMASGYHPADFAQHVATARAYVAAMNGEQP